MRSAFNPWSNAGQNNAGAGEATQVLPENETGEGKAVTGGTGAGGVDFASLINALGAGGAQVAAEIERANRASAQRALDEAAALESRNLRSTTTGTPAASSGGGGGILILALLAGAAAVMSGALKGALKVGA